MKDIKGVGFAGEFRTQSPSSPDVIHTLSEPEGMQMFGVEDDMTPEEALVFDEAPSSSLFDRRGGDARLRWRR
ncbi:hypothetical protein GF391_00835 [Candidatus Uhrbacteria bacterium]|nr:hypothetical protein [Candidatus Uhrbacteria bacterium]